MKKTVLTLAMVLGLSSYTKAQDTIKITDIYQSPSELIIEQFVVDYPGMSVEQIKSMVNKWALKIFNNPEVVTIGTTSESVVYKPLLKGTYNCGMGMYQEFKITCHTLIEFKDGKMRVTITEAASQYVTQYGISNVVRADYFKNKSEFKSTGMNAPFYRLLLEGKIVTNNYINSIKNIQPVKDNW